MGFKNLKTRHTCVASSGKLHDNLNSKAVSDQYKEEEIASSVFLTWICQLSSKKGGTITCIEKSTGVQAKLVANWNAPKHFRKPPSGTPEVNNYILRLQCYFIFTRSQTLSKSVIWACPQARFPWSRLLTSKEAWTCSYHGFTKTIRSRFCWWDLRAVEKSEFL